jgi:hypothetical protein
MSLAMYAAPFIENDEYKNNDNMIHKKKQIHNKTQKRFTKEGFDTEKVNNVLQTIHENSKVEDENESLADFNPPPKPESSGVKKTIATEQMMNMTNDNNQNMYKVLGKSPSPNEENNPELNLELNNYNMNYGNETEIEEYYKKFIPNYQDQKKNSSKFHSYYNNNNNNKNNLFNSEINDNNLLMQKLNYMINLLEEKQDEKTNNVTEEVVLYSFLGIFIIFIVDSFARMGKYVR